jgi:ATP-dependent Zn protease
LARLRVLPKRTKRILIGWLLVVTFMFAGLANGAYQTRGGTLPPIEIPYSSFLNILERQRKSIGDAAASPLIDRVQIGTDRIVYRITRPKNLRQLQDDSGLSSLPWTRKKILPGIRAERMNPNYDEEEGSGRLFLNAYTRKVPASPELVGLLREGDVPFTAAPKPKTPTVAVALRTVVVGFYFVILWRLYKTVSGGGGIGAGKGEVPGKLASTSDVPLAKFDDIQGIDEAKTEVMELVDTLMFPEKYAILGARAPTGLLLEGPPGTGKTMLARATAASAGVPLLYCSGSDFVEMFVGRGAARVRKLFERAERLSPCIIFIDELDALGKARVAEGLAGSGFSRSNDEAEQTLNQLLACMDGLDSSRRICVLAATNRREVLDPALVRPGRFDRIVKLKLPDARGRENILRVHASKLPGFTEGTGVDPDRPGALGKGRLVDLGAVAAVTEGFSGAELEYLVNEAAIRAVRRVSAALQRGKSATDITPHVEAADFEESLKSFYETRKPRGGRVNDLLKNVWKKP